jgi:hypothetical protein
VIVPLDGSELAENVLPFVVELAKALKLEILLLRAYRIPANTYAGVENYYPVNYEEIRVALRATRRKVTSKKKSGHSSARESKRFPSPYQKVRKPMRSLRSAGGAPITSSPCARMDGRE